MSWDYVLDRESLSRIVVGSNRLIVRHRDYDYSSHTSAQAFRFVSVSLVFVFD